MSSSYLDLERELRRAGFEPEWGKGSHRKWRHPSGAFTVLKSNCLGRTAGAGTQAGVRRVIERARRAKC